MKTLKLKCVDLFVFDPIYSQFLCGRPCSRPGTLPAARAPAGPGTACSEPAARYSTSSQRGQAHLGVSADLLEQVVRLVALLLPGDNPGQLEQQSAQSTVSPHRE